MLVKLVNINYKARVPTAQLDKLTFRQHPPIMATLKVPKFNCTLVIFRTGKCRIMGLKHVLTQDMVNTWFPLEGLELGPIQSCTWTVDFQAGPVNLAHLNNCLQRRSIFEPELFPALQLLSFKPVCVNVFHTGKCVITGIKTLAINTSLLDRIFELIYHAMPIVR
jgi:TATA-box binding protein (TBP) (component of TFIID and TFIIIB)